MLFLTFLLGLIVGSVTNQAICQADMIIPIHPSRAVTTIQPPVGVPSHAYTNPSSGVVTVQPPAELPSHIYTNPSNGSQMIQSPGQLPTMIYPSR